MLSVSDSLVFIFVHSSFNLYFLIISFYLSSSRPSFVSASILSQSILWVWFCLHPCAFLLQTAFSHYFLLLTIFPTFLCFCIHLIPSLSLSSSPHLCHWFSLPNPSAFSPQTILLCFPSVSFLPSPSCSSHSLASSLSLSAPFFASHCPHPSVFSPLNCILLVIPSIYLFFVSLLCSFSPSLSASLSF